MDDYYIPIGFLFEPNDREAIWYLLQKVLGNELRYSVATEADLYSQDQTWKNKFHMRTVEQSSHEDKVEEETHFFFNMLKKKEDNGSRIDRTVGAGFATWKSQKDTPIYDHQNNLIGSVRSFSYKKRSRSQERWVMHEYRLDGENKCHPNEKNYVMSKVILKK